MFHLLRPYRHPSDRNSWSSRYPSFGDIPMTSFDTDGLVMSNISGPIYTNPDTFKTAYFFKWIGLPTIRNQWICWPKPHIFETALQNGFFGVRRVFLKPDIFEAKYVMNSGPVLNENFQVENGGQQCCRLSSPVLLHSLKAILLFQRKQLAISKALRLWNLLVRDEGV